MQKVASPNGVQLQPMLLFPEVPPDKSVAVSACLRSSRSHCKARQRLYEREPDPNLACITLRHGACLPLHAGH
jgi:hypothetical protein